MIKTIIGIVAKHKYENMNDIFKSFIDACKVE